MTPQAIILRRFDEAKTVPFAWGGVSDCLGWAASVAMDLTGVDPIAHLRGTYDTAIGARRVMNENHWASLGDVAGSIFDEVPVSQARSGDWAEVVNDDGTEAIGVVCGTTIAAKAETGMTQIPRGRARRTFRVAA